MSADVISRGLLILEVFDVRSLCSHPFRLLFCTSTNNIRRASVHMPIRIKKCTVRVNMCIMQQQGGTEIPHTKKCSACGEMLKFAPLHPQSNALSYEGLSNYFFTLLISWSKGSCCCCCCCSCSSSSSCC